MGIFELAALVTVLGAVFALLRWIRGLTVPKSPKFVGETIQHLRAVRAALNKRAQVTDPLTGNLRFRSPESAEELLALYEFLEARHQNNKTIFREVKSLLYPNQYRGLNRSFLSADKAIRKCYRVIGKLKVKDTEQSEKRAGKLIAKLVLKASNKIVNFDKKLIRSIDTSLELWAKRIG